MSNETSEEIKIKIAKAHAEMQKSGKIKDFCEENNISEATFHKHKNYKKQIEESEENDTNFENDFEPDASENDDDDEEIDEIDVMID